MSRLFIVLIFLILVFVAGYHIYQEYLLPLLIYKIENLITQNTPCKIKITNPELKFWGFEIPELKVNYKESLFLMEDLKLNISFLPLLSRELKLKGRGEINIKSEKFEFKIVDFLYAQDTKNLNLKIYFPNQELNSYLMAVTLFYPVYLKGLESIQGICDLNLELVKTDVLKLNLLTRAENISLRYNGTIFSSPILNAKYEMTDESKLLRTKFEDCSITMEGSKQPFLAGGEFLLETDFEKIKLTQMKVKYKEILWQGGLTIENLKTIPLASYELSSILGVINGRIEKQKDLLVFNYKLTKEQNFLEGRGNYDLVQNYFVTEGCGQTTIESLISYFKTKFPQKLKSLKGNLDIRSYLIKYNRTKNILSSDLKANIENLKFAQNLIATKGSADLKLENKNIKIEDFKLEEELGRINITCLLSLNEKNPFQAKIEIINYDFQRLTRLFMPGDIGDALLSAQGYFNGNLKELSSLKAIMNWNFKEGKIGKLKFLSHIDTLLGKPQLEEVAFNTGRGKIELKNNLAKISETNLSSPYLDLFVAGSITLSGDMNLTVVTEFKPEKSILAPESPFKKFGEILFKGVEEIFYKIQITGNIKEPKYTLIPASIDKFFKELLPSYK